MKKPKTKKKPTTPTVCSCMTRWPDQLTAMAAADLTGLIMNPEAVDGVAFLSFVSWFNGPWPFPPERTHTLITTFRWSPKTSPALAKFSPLIIVSHLGLGRCECGRVVVYGDRMVTNRGPISKLAARLPGGSAAAIKNLLWGQTLPLVPDLYKDALRQGGAFLPK